MRACERVADELAMSDKWAVSDIHSLAAKIQTPREADSPGCQLADFLPGHLAGSAQNVQLNSARCGHTVQYCLPSFRDCRLPLIVSELGIRASQH